MLQENGVTQAERSSPIVVVESLVKRFGSFAALSDINLSVAKGEKIVLCGPSGLRQVDADPVYQPYRET